MSYVVRPADPADAQGLSVLGDAVAAEPEGWLATNNGWRTVGDERRYLRAIRRYPHAGVFVAFSYLGLMVAQSHRRMGIGRALLAAAVEWARANDVRKLELHVFPYNTAAIALYEQFGFEHEGYRKQHYRRGDEFVDAILMAYNVTAT